MENGVVDEKAAARQANPDVPILHSDDKVLDACDAGDAQFDESSNTRLRKKIDL
jgi:hypothetical protein